jgi:hypothetical protein
MCEPSRPSEFALYDHQKFHPATQMAELHSAKSKIAPTWTKVTSTPWEARAILNGGYGRKLKRTAISSDCPTTFINPEQVPPPIVPRMGPKEANVTRISKERDPEAMSYMLPGGRKDMNSPLYTAPPGKYRAFPCGKQMLLEPATKPRTDRSPIKWDRSPMSSARSLSSARSSMSNPGMTNCVSNPVSARNSSRDLVVSSSRGPVSSIPSSARMPSQQPSARLSNVILG